LNILLSGIVGSTAYGLANEHSDIDRIGVYAEPAVRFHGLHPPIDKAATKVSHNPDVTMHEARKMALLSLGCNPTVTEIMWLPENLYETRTELGDQLIAIRTAFVCAKRVRDAFFGYATSQLHRLVETGRFQSKMRARSSKHGRHILRLLDSGFGFYATGRLEVRVEDPQRYIEFGERVAADPEFGRTALADAEARFDAARSPLPAEPDEAAVERWLLEVRRIHHGGEQ
jgi:uncharacterized protein